MAGEPIACIAIPSSTERPGAAEVQATAEKMESFARELWRLAFDDSVRVVILSDGDPVRGLEDSPPDKVPAVDDGSSVYAPQWRLASAVLRVQYAFALMDKPVIAQVAEDVTPATSGMIFAADLIVMADHVRVRRSSMPNHGMGRLHASLDVIMSPFATPARGKDIALLGVTQDAGELARLGLVNYIVPPADVPSRVLELARALLRRPAYALAATKRVANKPLLHQLNASLGMGLTESAVASLDA